LEVDELLHYQQWMNCDPSSTWQLRSCGRKSYVRILDCAAVSSNIAFKYIPNLELLVKFCDKGRTVVLS